MSESCVLEETVIDTTFAAVFSSVEPLAITKFVALAVPVIVIVLVVAAWRIIFELPDTVNERSVIVGTAVTVEVDPLSKKTSSFAAGVHEHGPPPEEVDQLLPVVQAVFPEPIQYLLAASVMVAVDTTISSVSHPFPKENNELYVKN